MTSNFSESNVRDAVHEGQERLHEGRRHFFKALGVGATVASGIGAALRSTPALAQGRPYAAAFALNSSRTYMNIGSTGSTPLAVLKNLATNNALFARDPTLSLDTQDIRNTIAPGFGADPFELVMSFNTTDGMGKIINGLDFKAGDEIITTNMEHPSGSSPMNITAERRGVVIKRVMLPTNDAYSDSELLARFQALLTNRTRAIVFSSPTFLTGIRLPEKLLCQWAASMGLISVIDGAHGPGMLNLNLHDIGCDFYAGSGHKWQCGPGQTGILYVRNNSWPAAPSTYTKNVTVGGVARTLTLPGYTNTTPLPAFWPTVTHGYSTAAGAPLQGGIRDPNDNIAATLMTVGHPSYPALSALQECCAMWDTWGRQNIEDYVVSLAQYLRSRLTAIWGTRCMSSVYDVTVPHHARIALTSFNPFSPGYDYNAVLTASQSATQAAASSSAAATLLNTHGIVISSRVSLHSLRGNPTVSAGLATGSYPLRISTHLFHNTADVDDLVNKLLLVVPHP